MSLRIGVIHLKMVVLLLEERKTLLKIFKNALILVEVSNLGQVVYVILSSIIQDHVMVQTQKILLDYIEQSGSLATAEHVSVIMALLAVNQ